jgi:hypothetical protein
MLEGNERIEARGTGVRRQMIDLVNHVQEHLCGYREDVIARKDSAYAYA